jgi:CBS domain containing-hemolysin-like protein
MTTGFVVLVVALLAMCSFAALAVAGRSLNRLQRRVWANGPREPVPEAEQGAAAVESAFIALGMARQIALVAVVSACVSLATGLELSPAIGWGVLSAAVLYVVFDKLLPYRLVILFGAPRVLSTGRPLYVLVRVLIGPLARHLQRTVARARERNQSEERDPERRDLVAFLDLAEEEGLVSDDEDSLLRGVADFEDTVVREVMTPRMDIIAIDGRATLRDLRQLIAEHRFSRIPVIREDLDHVVGVVNLKDLIIAMDSGGDDTPISEFVRPAWYVPETKHVSDLLKEFQRRQAQLTIVVDEYGGTAGLATLEDVLEEIVGEIQDETDEEEELVRRVDDFVIASGKAEVEDVERALGVRFPEDEYHTLGGMVFTRLGHVPEAGETFEHEGLLFEVLEADERRILRVRIGSL